MHSRDPGNPPAPTRRHANAGGSDCERPHSPRRDSLRTPLAAVRRRPDGPGESTPPHDDGVGPETARRTSHGCELGESGRELGATAVATRLEHRTTRAVAHPKSETVLLLAFPIVGLEGPLHAWPPRRGNRPQRPERRRSRTRGEGRGGGSIESSGIRSQRGADSSASVAGSAPAEASLRLRLRRRHPRRTERRRCRRHRAECHRARDRGTAPSRAARISQVPGDDSTPRVELHQ